MKILTTKIRTVGFAFLMGLTLSLGACSTGTSDGETNVEESDGKDKDPMEHSDNAENKPQASTDTTNLEGAYERTDGDKGVHNRDNDGQADK